jgi:glycogen synthase
MIGLLYHGRLEKEKGFDAILEMMKIVSHQDYEFFIF